MTKDFHSQGLHQVKAWFSTHKALWVLFTIAVILRLSIYFFYAPVSYSDSRTYLRLASQILRGWIYYDGSRTPGYPAFLAVLRSEQNAWLAQLGMGVVITLLMYFIGWQLGAGLGRGKRQKFAFLVGLAHTLNLGQLFFESSLLSETLATFWIVLSVAGLVYSYSTPKARTVWLAGLMGLFSALAILTRGLFILLPFWALLVIWLDWAEKPTSGLQLTGKNLDYSWRMAVNRLHHIYPVLLAFIVPFSLLIGLWVSFIRHYYNQWGLETIGGYRLVQNTGSFFELVPDEYAALRDTYLKYRDAKIDRTGTQTNAIWKAIPEMMEASGLGFYDLSRLLTKLSLDLIREHPDLYLKNVAEGWWLFWRAPVYWEPDSVRLSGAVPALAAIIFVERLILWGVNAFFLLSSLGIILPMFRRRWNLSPILGYLAGLIWSTSILQSFLDHGDNPRFLVPLQSFLVLWALWFGFRFLGQDEIEIEQECKRDDACR